MIFFFSFYIQKYSQTVLSCSTKAIMYFLLFKSLAMNIKPGVDFDSIEDIIQGILYKPQEWA